MSEIVFDTFAVVAWLRKEEHSGYVSDLVRRVADAGARGGICLINLGEVYYIISRKDSPERAERVLADLMDVDWAIYPVTQRLTLAAARLKARFPISYADAFAVACAQEQGASLVTGDREIHKAPHGVPILWPGVADIPEEQSVEQ